MASREKIIADLIEKNSPLIKKGFLLSIEKIKDEALVSEIIRHLKNNNIQAAVEAVGINRAAYRIFETSILQAYEEGGVAMAESFPILNTSTGKKVFRFDVTNPVSEIWLKNNSTKLITRIVDDQKTAIRVFMTDGLATGQNPRTTALDIVGRVSRVTKRREGGIIGLSSPQEQYVANAKSQLLSGDSNQMRAYLTRTRRDRRFDSAVKKAIKEGKPLNKITTGKAVGRYSDRLVQLRGETIARTESLNALNRAQYDSFRQAQQTGGVGDISRIWDTAGDSRVRDVHRFMDGQRRGLNEAFTSGTGASLLHPGDTSLGAGANDVIDCRCRVKTTIDFLVGIS